MLTAVWGPSLWHFLHIMSLNYPVKPTNEEKKHYKQFILSLQYILPCKYCRDNLKKNFKTHPLKTSHMKDRDSFSRYVYTLHEIVNTMLGKKSGLTYCDVRERYEHFRARCSNTVKIDRDKKEKGCTEPLYGKKAKGVIRIIPQDEKCETLEIDKKCLKTKK